MSAESGSLASTGGTGALGALLVALIALLLGGAAFGAKRWTAIVRR